MFEVGKEINRRNDIHALYGGQRQGGISTPKDITAIFIFTSPTGEAHGYSDEFREDGTYWYTGEGQLGDMAMQKGNKAIYEHQKNNKELYLFEYTRTAHVRLLGKAEYIGHHTEHRPDNSGELRDAFVFHLSIIQKKHATGGNTPKGIINIDPKKISHKNKPLSELRALALNSGPSTQSATQKQREIHVRSQAIKEYVLKRANGCCEHCEKPAPFDTRKGPYLECHHILRLSDGGPDHPNNVIGLCPNCHREAHYSVSCVNINQRMLSTVLNIESK